jgi:hypothetical protein
MQHINPDMDDLFRKASENYPLKVGSDRWEEIASKLDKNPSPAKKTNKRDYKKYLFLFLFLFAFLFLFDYFLTNNSDQKNAGQKNYLDKTNSTIEQTISVTRDKPGPVTNSTPSSNNNGSSEFTTGSLEKQASKPITIFPFNAVHPAATTDSKEIRNNAGNYLSGTKTRNDVFAEPLRRSTAPFLNLQLEKGKGIEILPFTLQRREPGKNKTHSFYHGVSAGAGVTRIMKQEVNKAGFEIGVIGGYRLNDRFSLETGLSFANKYYQTAGEHFSMKTVGSSMPAGMKIMEVESNTQLLQIPLHIRYAILSKTRHRVIAAAGVSTYILMKESNSYHMMMNGAGSMMYSTYKNRPVYIAGSFDLLIGYEKTIGARTDLRIEPYLQLPLKGVGVGELQLKTAGLRLVLTRSSK